MYIKYRVFFSQYKTIHCKTRNKNSVCKIRYHTYHNALENLNQFIYRFTKTFYSVNIQEKCL